jgi:hypothetical protein
MLFRETIAVYCENHTGQIQILVFKGVKPCCLVDSTNLPHKSPTQMSELKREVADSSEMLEHIYKTAWCHTPENNVL